MTGIFKAYDIRGLYQAEVTEEIVSKIGKAFVAFLKMKGKCEKIVVGRDARIGSPELHDVLIKSITEQGVDVYDIGQCSTDLYYFSVAKLGADGGAMVTASHNPKEYNGVKVVRDRAIPIGSGSGMEEIQEFVEKGDFVSVDEVGNVEKKDLLNEFIEYVNSYADVSKIKDLKVVMDASNGVGGPVAEAIFDALPIEIIKMNFEPDGEFPGHGPNPLLEENHKALVEKVKAEGADLGITWDGDCDRCFFIDEKGEMVPGDFVTGLLAKHVLVKNPGSVIYFDLRASDYVRDVIAENGGVAKESRVGHAFFKEYMRRDNAIFAGEITGHYYFRGDDYWADNGFIPPLQIMEMMCSEGKKLSELLAETASYHISGEINSEVVDKKKVFDELQQKYSDGGITHLDGISVRYPDWHFNVRASNTEPKIRLNLEAKSKELMEQKRDEVLAVIRR